jgi:hypothetical protein
MARRVDDANPNAADRDLGAVVEAAVDALLGDLHLTAPYQDRSARRGTHGVVGHPVIGVPVRRDNGLHAALGSDCREQRFLIERHVNQRRHSGGHVADHIRVVPVRPHRADLDDADTTVLEDGDLSAGHALPTWRAPFATRPVSVPLLWLPPAREATP